MYKLAFPGASHTGHTVVAAILDSHPNVCMVNVYYSAISMERLLERAKDPRQWLGDPYSYNLPGQGDTTEIKLVGITGRELNLDLEGRYVNMLRNPFDVIGSTYRKRMNRVRNPKEDTVESYENSLKQMEECGGHYMYHEDFVKDPVFEMRKCLEYLELEYTSEWLAAGVSIVIKEIITSRHYFPWTDKDKDQVYNIMNENRRLKRYAFERF